MSLVFIHIRKTPHFSDFDNSLRDCFSVLPYFINFFFRINFCCFKFWFKLPWFDFIYL